MTHPAISGARSQWWPAVRLLTAGLILLAITSQLALTLSNAAEATTPWGSHMPTVIGNFFSFFTILSNVAAMVTFSVGATWALRQRRDPSQLEPAWLSTLLVCVSTYMLVTGVVYGLLLRGVELPQGSTVWWSNEILHVVAPLLVLADVLFAPRRRAMPWKTVLVVAVFPVVWAAYTLIRANLITAPSTGNTWWYPYPFLDPRVVGGYGAVSIYIVGIAAAIIGFAALVVWVGHRRACTLQPRTAVA